MADKNDSSTASETTGSDSQEPLIHSETTTVTSSRHLDEVDHGNDTLSKLVYSPV